MNTIIIFILSYTPYSLIAHILAARLLFQIICQNTFPRFVLKDVHSIVLPSSAVHYELFLLILINSA